MHRRVISAVEKEDFLKVYQQSITYVDGEPAPNQWTYDSTIKAAKVNANRGYFRFYLGQCYAGDKINIKAEVYNISGVKVHASVDFSNSGYNSELGTSGLNHTTKYNDWEIINFDYILPKDAKFVSVVIGLSMGEVGQYYLKNVVITVDSMHCPGEYFRNVVATAIKKVNGQFVQHDTFENNPCTISQLDSNILRIVFSDLTNYAAIKGTSKWCMGWTTQEFHNNTYFIRVRSQGPDTVDIQFRDPTTNAIIPLADVVEGTSFVVYAMV